MGACFQAPLCHTQTETNGNAPCSLIFFFTFIFQYASRDKLHGYVQIISDNNKSIIILIILVIIICSKEKKSG